jgi:hypothetical protein
MKESLALEIPAVVSSIKGYGTNQEVPFKPAGLKNYYIFDLSKVKFNEIDTIFEITLK